MKDMPSREDVARRAGVSGAAVSYVLNNTPGARISETTRRVVRAAAGKLGYRCSHAARSLATGRFRQIGILGPSGDTLFAAYHEGILRGIWQAATEVGYRIVVDAAQVGRPIAFLEERFVDGFVALAAPKQVFTEEVRERLKRTKLPVVVVGGAGWMREFHRVRIDDLAIGRRAAACLFEHGHRNIAVLGGHGDHDTAYLRGKGFLEAMKRRGVEGSAIPIVKNGYSREEAYPDALRLLKEGRVTAVFCVNDNVALAVLQAAQELGVRVPEDLSLIGVDAIEAGQHTTPPLASFRQPLEAMGETAFTLLMKNPKRPAHRVFEPEFVKGGSVAACRRRRRRTN